MKCDTLAASSAQVAILEQLGAESLLDELLDLVHDPDWQVALDERCHCMSASVNRTLDTVACTRNHFLIAVFFCVAQDSRAGKAQWQVLPRSMSQRTVVRQFSRNLSSHAVLGVATANFDTTSPFPEHREVPPLLRQCHGEQPLQPHPLPEGPFGRLAVWPFGRPQSAHSTLAPSFPRRMIPHFLYYSDFVQVMLHALLSDLYRIPSRRRREPFAIYGPQRAGVDSTVHLSTHDLNLCLKPRETWCRDVVRTQMVVGT